MRITKGKNVWSHDVAPTLGLALAGGPSAPRAVHEDGRERIWTCPALVDIPSHRT